MFVCGGFPIAIATVIKFQTDLTTNNAALIAYTLFNTLGNTVMGALPVFVGNTASKNEVVTIGLGQQLD